MAYLTKQRVNKAIEHLGLEIVGKKGDGYFYFSSLETGEQVGESVMICYLHQCTLDEWVTIAEKTLSDATEKAINDLILI